ncbi:MAG: amylo-alpha-1,6-glucosidase [Thermodesulfobacteriota bacterium]
MGQVKSVTNQYYILATSALEREQTRVIKEGETFAILNRYGDIEPTPGGVQGIYHRGTRHLSRFEFRLEGHRPLMLTSTVRQDLPLVSVDLTNPDFCQHGRIILPKNMVHLARSLFLWQSRGYLQFRFKNYTSEEINLNWFLDFGADFADIFEVRGTCRPARGQLLPPQVQNRQVRLSYQGLDGVIRRTSLEFSHPPLELGGSQARFLLAVPGGGETVVYCTITCEGGQEAACTAADYELALAQARADLTAWESRCCQITTSNDIFNEWLRRSLEDLHMMVTRSPQGIYPYAGIPWFSTPFGRDGLITAWQFLWANPELARGVLSFLAATQARERIPDQDAEPGKIIHEMRQGEMAALKEIPFGTYYGSVDAPPLFVMLAGAYLKRSGDTDYLLKLWPHLEMALEWMDRHGDRDGDGWVEYLRESPLGLVNQGWKDSHDAVFHGDGRLAEGAIALCEVQAYVYGAKCAGADLARQLGYHRQAEEWQRQARRLKERFNQQFWDKKLGVYILALDGVKEPCRVKASNAGHCLFAGIAKPRQARRLAHTLFQPEFFNGWGIRTVAATEARYNPMAYHNGSVWPHDNALIAYGLARYGFKEEALKILRGLFDAARTMELNRLPELFCGFDRRPGEGPVPYPVACSPQAWCAGTVFLLLQSILGLDFDAGNRCIYFNRPVLPDFLQRLWLRNLQLGEARVDLCFSRYDNDVTMEVLHRQGKLQIMVIK